MAVGTFELQWMQALVQLQVHSLFETELLFYKWQF